MRPDVLAAGQQVIDFEPGVEDGAQADAARRRDGQADGVARLGIEWQQKRQRMYQVRGVAQQAPALQQRLAHQRHVELRQIADATVDELGRGAARAAGEIPALDEAYAVAARGGIQRDTRPRDAPTDHQDVERLPDHRRQVRAPGVRVQLASFARHAMPYLTRRTRGDPARRCSRRFPSARTHLFEHSATVLAYHSAPACPAAIARVTHHDERRCRGWQVLLPPPAMPAPAITPVLP